MQSVYEIDRSNVLADASAKLRDFYVFGMNGVGVERGAVSEHRDQSAVVRARQMQRVKSHRETLNFRNNPRQAAQEIYMFVPSELLYVISILPDHNVCQHFSSFRRERL